MKRTPSRRIRECLRRVVEGSGTGVMSRLIRGVLIPMVPLYRIARAGHQRYRAWRPRELPRPVVSVGNLRVGGTGKTSFVIWLLGRLLNRGFRPAVLKRGTGREEGVLSEGDKADPSEWARRYGDEVALIRHRHPAVPVGVGADRHARGREILARHDVDLFLLDDGFQRRNLARDLDVVLLGSLRELSEWQLPAGPLREPASALGRADFVSLNTTVEEGWRAEPRLRRAAGPTPSLLTHAYRFRGIRRDGRDVTERFRSRPGNVLTTLARPDSFLQFLRRAGIRVGRTIHHPDHALLSRDHLKEAGDPRDLLLTPKEWVKLDSDLRRTVNLVCSDFVVEPRETLPGAVERTVRTPAAKNASESGGGARVDGG